MGLKMNKRNFPEQRRIFLAVVGEKKRPVLVVSIDERNEYANDVLVVPISTTMREAPTHVKLYPSRSGLKEPSTVKCEQITTIKKDELIGSPIGRIGATDFSEIQKGILRAIGVPID